MKTIIILFLCFLRVQAFGQTAPDVDTELNKLRDPVTTKEAAATLAAMARAQPSLLDRLDGELRIMLSQARDLDVMDTEAGLSADLKLYATIPILVQLLDPSKWHIDPGKSRISLGGLTWQKQLRDDAIARAIYDMGPVATSALDAPLASSEARVRRKACRILLLTNTPESRLLLENHLGSENDPDLRRFLLANGIRLKQ